jgi:hypothetical protein
LKILFWWRESARYPRISVSVWIFPASILFIRENLSGEINPSQNSIQSRQYCAPLGCGNAAAANAVRLKG